MGENRCDNRAWGFLATNIPNPPACVKNCRQKFLEGLLPEDETFDRVCGLLSDNGNTKSADESFWALYCCGSQLCGVNNLESGGEDPNVNWVINTCQNLGYDSVLDPGPPKASYRCNLAPLVGKDPLCQKQEPASQTSSTTQSLEKNSMPSTSHKSTSMATSTQSSIRDPSLAASLDPSKSDDEGDGHSGGLSTGVKVTIGLAAMVGVMIISLIVFCILRYRPRLPRRRRNFRQLIKRHDSPVRAECPTLLVSPAISRTDPDGVPLTPPLPLKERKMLDVGVSSRPSSAGQPRVRAGFPASPVFAPTMSKLVPRSESTSKAHEGVASPPMSPPGWVATAEGSLRSFSSIPGTTTASATSATATNSSERIATTPARPQRSRDTPLDIPSPGPPPTRALPSTPPNGPAMQHNTSASSVRHGDIGVAIGVVCHNPADGVVLGSESHDLCELTEQYGREPRNSYGSWRGGGGGGPGAAAMSPQKKISERDVHGPVMEEVDLERLGGRY